uniref:Uncharacterized protein n=1 Tax=Gouania willdenowi TaxID=441366 RepID=A0A8C5DJH1_GOUWI
VTQKSFFHLQMLHLLIVRLISFSLRLFCRLPCFLFGRPGSPWHCGWPRCLDPHREGSPGHSGGNLGLASHQTPPNQPFNITHDSPSPNLLLSFLHRPSAPGVVTPASTAEAAVTLRASSSCRCRCSSIDTPALDQHWDQHQTQSHWHQVPSWSLLLRPEWETKGERQPGWVLEGP